MLIFIQLILCTLCSLETVPPMTLDPLPNRVLLLPPTDDSYPKYPHIEAVLKKLDGVGPVDNRPSTDKLHHFVRKKIKKYVTCDTRHVTCDM